MKISMLAQERLFDAKLHLAAIDEDPTMGDRLVFASFAGIPEATRAIAAGFMESRPLNINNNDYSRFTNESYKMLVKPIGLGDVAHGVIYHAHATLDGLADVANVDEEDNLKSYVVAQDGRIEQALANHVAKRFSLPSAWKDQYYSLFAPYIRDVSIIRNPALDHIWPHFKMLRLEISERQVKDMMTNALSKGILKIEEQGDVKGVFEPGMTMKEYLTKNAEILAKKLSAKMPRYVSGGSIHVSIGDMKRVPFPSQAAVVQGLWEAFQDGHNTTIINGTMGTGKSIMACAMANRFHSENLKKGKKGTAILLSAPSITLKKWKYKEILGTLPNAKVTIINSTEDAAQLVRKVQDGYQPKGLEFYLLSLDRAKLGHVPHFAGIWKRIKGTKDQYAWHCPDCHRPIMKLDDDGEEYIPLEWNDVAFGYPPEPDELYEDKLLPNGLTFIPKWNKKGKRFEKCNYHKANEDAEVCECKLWRPAVKNRGETNQKPRWNTSRILKKIKGYFDLYICDEVHQAKAEDSGRGDAFAQLAQTAPKRLLLTGTLTTGRSSSIKEILWRTMPEMLLKQGFDHQTSSVKWAKRYGKVKTVIEHKTIDDGWIVRKKKKPLQPREEAGINPQLTVQLLDFTAFLDITDIGLPLVPLKEQVEIVSLDPEHQLEYQKFHEELHEKCRKRAMAGAKGAFAKFIPSTINYVGRADLGAQVRFNTDDEEEIISAPAFGKDYFTAKERKLVEIVRKEMAEGRGCVIYNNYTASYGMNDRTKYVLEKHGIDAVILDEPNTLKRSERLQQLEEQGVKVIICNMKLVEVGLDLMTWPTIIYNQLCYEINTVRQASRRAWRVGQDRECRVIYLVADGTQEMAQFMDLVKQRTHALMVEGVLDKSPLADYAKDEQSTLASDLANCFAKSGLADVWQSLAEKELEDIEIVEENEFKQILQERMKQLSNKTRELCGLPPMEERMIKSVEPEPLINPDRTEQLDLFDMYEIEVVDLNEYKGSKRGKKHMPVEGQLAFNFGS